MPEKYQYGGYMDMSERIVLCGANSYEQKYYFNKEQFGKLPEDIQDELHIICVLFTEEVGGIFTVEFDENGSLCFETQAADNDYLYDEIGSGLMIREIERNRAQLLHSLELYYKIFILHQGIDQITEENSPREV